MPTPSSITTTGLVKKALADRLLAEIISGVLVPGERIVEGRWAQKFGVAQGSIREAINILERDGYVTKESGRSARVVNLTAKDVVQLYQLRGCIEGLAARLAAVAQPDFSPLQTALNGMRAATASSNADDLLDRDLEFHLQLCRLSGNGFLEDYANRILRPFFAFVRLRITADRKGTSVWQKDLEAHQRILDLLRDGEGEVAEQYVVSAMVRFAKTAYENWVSHGK